MDVGSQKSAEATAEATAKPGNLLHRLNMRRRTTFFGWWMVGISFIGHLMSGGFYSTGLTVYFLPISRDLGLSRAALSLAFTLRSLEGGLDGPLVGYLVDRKGARFMVRLGIVLGGAGFILLAFTHSYFTFLLVFLGLLAIGISAGVHHPFMALTNQWFIRRRAMAMTVGFVGSEVGGTLITPIIALVIFYFGWRQGAIISGVLLVAVIIPLTFFIRNSPESMGLHPDGVKRGDEPSEALTKLRQTAGPTAGDEGDFTVQEAIHSWAYWHFALAMGARIFAKSALHVHLVPLLVWKGLDERTAALLVGLFSFSQVPLRVGASMLGDSWSMTKVPSLTALAGIAAVAVLLMGRDGSVWTGVFFALLFSLAESSNTTSWAITGHFFGRRNFGTLRGGVSTIQSLMSLPAPTLAGWVFDRTLSYNGALFPVAGAYILTFLLYWTLRPPRQPARLQDRDPANNEPKES